MAGQVGPASGGTSGYSGVSGHSGISGYSGFSGRSGYSGYSGTGGAAGTSGYSGYSGLGTSGYSGFSGSAGAGGTNIALLGSASIDLNDDSAKQNIYTVPVGKKAVVAIIVMRSFSGAASVAELSFGWVDADDVTAVFTLSDPGSPSTGDAVLLHVFISGGTTMLRQKIAIGNAADVFGATVTTEEGSVLTCVADIFGYTYDA